MKVIVQNLAIEYKDEGSGKILLFLHGWQGNLQSFDTLVPLLTTSYRVIRVDLPGFGKSETQKEVWDLDTYVAFLNNFIEKLNLEIYALVGHSFGGRIAIKGEARKILHARKIVLVASAGVAQRKNFRNFFFKVVAKIGKCVTYIPPLLFWREGLRRKMYTFIGSDYMNAGVLKKTFLKIIAEDLTENAKSITVPTLLVWGETDKETPLSDGLRLSKMIANSSFKTLKDCGHFVYKEKPKEVAELIQKFL